MKATGWIVALAIAAGLALAACNTGGSGGGSAPGSSSVTPTNFFPIIKT